MRCEPLFGIATYMSRMKDVTLSCLWRVSIVTSIMLSVRPTSFTW